MSLSLRKFSVLLTALVCLLAAVPASADSRRSKLDKVLRDALRQPPKEQRVIIQTRPGSRAFVKRSLQAHGDVVEAEHPSLNALTVRLHGEDLQALEADPNIVAMSVDAEVTSFAAKRSKKPAPAPAAKGKNGKAPAAKGGRDGNASGNGGNNDARRRNRDPKPPVENLLRVSLGLDTVPFKGSGINVAVVDSGLEANRDLAHSIAGFWDFTRGGIPTQPSDNYGHGTHIAGLIASSGTQSRKEFGGIAPDVRLYGLKVLDWSGRGRSSDVVKALEFIVANKLSDEPGAFKIDVINLSLGHPIYEPAASDPLVIAVENAVRAGIIVVAAAGNVGSDGEGENGYAGILSPGNAPSAITVGAADTKLTQTVSDDRVAYFSSRGPTWFDGFAKPDVVAAGVGLVSDAPRYSQLFESFPQLKSWSKSGSNSFAKLSGTSMSAAVTTGIVSLVLEASRGVNTEGALTPNALKAVMQFTALPLSDDNGQRYDALTQGTGEVNARGAVSLALSINTAMPVGSDWLRTPLVPVTQIGGQALGWSQSLIWDDNIVWGTDALLSNGEQWDDNIVWGTDYACDPNDAGCENIVWGTLLECDDACENIVWGTAAELDNIVWGTAIGWAVDIVWGNRVVGLMGDDDNIVWGTLDGLDEDNIVWGTFDGDNIVWGTFRGGENIVWGTFDLDLDDADNIVWGTLFDDDNIVWGTLFDSDNIVWGTLLKGGLQP